MPAQTTALLRCLGALAALLIPFGTSAATLTSLACPEPELATDAGITCGSFDMPQDWDTVGSGQTLSIYVVRVPSLAAEPAPDPVVFLSGGPGFGSSRLWRSALSHPLWLALRERRDLILIDERGTGRSQPAVCPAQDEAKRQLPSRGLAPAASEAESLRLIRVCESELARQGRALEHYRSRFVGRDLAALREALGLRSWNLIGASYAARQVLAALHHDPEGIRAAVLPSPSMPNAAFQTKRGFDDALALVVDRCAADPACAAEFPNLDVRLAAVLEALDREPMVVEGLDPTQHADGRLVLDGELAGQSIGLMLYQRTMASVLPAAVRALEQRDAHVVRTMAGALGGSNSANQLLLAVLPCLEAIAFEDPQAMAQAHAEAGKLGRVAGGAQFAVCSALRPQTDPRDQLAEDHGVPLLAMAGDFDPVTPATQVREAIAALPAAQFVELPQESHNFLGSRDGLCGRRLLTDFLDEPTAPIDRSCLAEMPPLRFATGLHPSGRPAAAVAAVGAQPLALAALIGALLLLASTPLVAARSLLRRGGADGRSPVHRLSLLAGLCALMLVGIVGFAGWSLIREMPLALAFGLPTWVAPWFSLSWALLALGLALSVQTVAGFRRGSLSRAIASYRVLVALSAVGLGAFAASLGLP